MGVSKENTHVSATNCGAYISELTIENVACFGPRQVLHLARANKQPFRWTVLIGNNGTGKTTLLRSLAGFALRKEPPSLEGWVYQLDPQMDFLYGHNRSSEKTGVLQCEYVCSGQIGSHGQVHLIHLASAEIGSEYISHATIPPDSNWCRLSTDEGEVIIYGYGATRKMGRSTLSEMPTPSPTSSLDNEDASLINAEEWLLRLDYRQLRSKDAKAHLDFERVRDLLCRVLPDVHDIKVEMTSEVRAAGRVMCETDYGWVHVQKLGLGYKTMAAWTVDLASRLFERYPDSPDPLAEPAIVLVDEIDLHLHPQWQRQIIRYLTERFTNTQFIVTAHSPLVVQGATEDTNIVLLRREGDHVVIDNDVESVRGWRTDQVLTSDLFGLETARSPEFDGPLKEREEILSKAELTEEDRDRVRALDAMMAELPTQERREDQEALDIIRRAAEHLKQTGGAGG